MSERRREKEVENEKRKKKKKTHEQVPPPGVGPRKLLGELFLGQGRDGDVVVVVVLLGEDAVGAPPVVSREGRGVRAKEEEEGG